MTFVGHFQNSNQSNRLLGRKVNSWNNNSPICKYIIGVWFFLISGLDNAIGK
jgi:hypothetical protein